MKHFKLFHSPAGEDSDCAYHTSLERKVNAIIMPFQYYIRNQTIASVILLVLTIAALLCASITLLTPYYYAFVNANLGFHIHTFVFEKTLKFWVNDVLLTLFFFFVGLEIKRELLVGELSQPKKAMLTIFCAIGGMVIPGLIYFYINAGTPAEVGWGIPMATDTAFALGFLTCFKHKLPKGIFTFVAAVAIIDDIGSIFIIAIFYNHIADLSLLYLALVFISILVFVNFAGIRNPLPYIFIGIIIWALIELANIHGVVVGIIVAFLIPARPKHGPKQFLSEIKILLMSFEKKRNQKRLVLEDQQQHLVLEQVQNIAHLSTTPLQHWKSKLELPVVLLVLPIFAFVNAGIPVDLSLIDKIFVHPVSLGILLGLLLGKPIGILLFGYFSLHLRLAILPDKLAFKNIVNVSLLTSIGFTMSLFIADLSFNGQEEMLVLAKAAIIFASCISGILGILLLMISK